MKKSLIAPLFLFIIIVFVSASENATTNAEILENEVVLSDSLQIFTKVLFGLDSETGINLSQFIVLIVMLIVMYSMVVMAVGFVPMFSSKPIKYFISFAITFLISFSGGIRNITLFLFDFSKSLNFISDYEIFGIIISIVILLMVYFIAKVVFKLIRNQLGIDEAKGTAKDIVKAIINAKKKP
jgi:hypothetical protein